MKINYLTWIQDNIGCPSETISLPGTVKTVSDLLDWLENKDEKYKKAFKNRGVIYAEVNGSIVDHHSPIHDDMQITVFAPIVGG